MAQLLSVSDTIGLVLGVSAVFVVATTVLIVFVIVWAVRAARRGAQATLAALAREGLVLESGWIWLTYAGVMLNQKRTTRMNLALTQRGLVLFSNKPFCRVDVRDFGQLDAWMDGDRLHLAAQIWSDGRSLVRSRVEISTSELDAPAWLHALRGMGARVHFPRRARGR